MEAAFRPSLSGAQTDRPTTGGNSSRRCAPAAALSKRTPSSGSPPGKASLALPAPVPADVDDDEQVYVPILVDSHKSATPASSDGVDAAMQEMVQKASALAAMAKGNPGIEAAAARFAAEMDANLRLRQLKQQKTDSKEAPGPLGLCCLTVRGAVDAILKAIVTSFDVAKTPVVFYFVGCVVYGWLEGWHALDTVYFLTVTSTTVGCELQSLRLA